MKHLMKGIACLILLSGLGHLLLALNYDNPPMLAKSIVGGFIYLILGLLVLRGHNKALLASAIIMLIASIGSVLTMKVVGYPIILMKYFLALNITVVSLAVLYSSNVIRTRTN